MVDTQQARDLAQRLVALPFRRVEDTWRRLDRGWRAVALGLGVVAVHLLGQAL